MMSQESTAAWLRHYGWLNDVTDRDAIADAACAWQASVGLQPDGVIGPKSQSVMRAPRCGCTDVLQNRSNQMRWHKKKLTWSITSAVGDTISLSEQEDLTQEFWEYWTRHIDLDIDKAPRGQRADIDIGAARGRRANFDGPSGTLAWAELPPGDDRPLTMRFDLDEYWVRDLNVSQAGILYLNVGCHEGGHILGLEHSRKAGALMAPYYSAAISEPQTSDDVTRIIQLYGARTSPPPPGGKDAGKKGGWGFHVPARAGDIISFGRAAA